jgi:hypothetical protein
VSVSGRSWSGVLPPGRKKGKLDVLCMERLYGNGLDERPEPFASLQSQDGKLLIHQTRNRNFSVTR